MLHNNVLWFLRIWNKENVKKCLETMQKNSSAFSQNVNNSTLINGFIHWIEESV